MKTKNPAKEFIKKVDELCKLERKLTDSNGSSTPEFWPFGWEHESNPEDCFKREDGLWELKHKINTHSKNGGYRVVFIWRIHPNYCCGGQPCSTNKNQVEFYDKSETEKVLYETDTLEFVWKWYDVIRPTDTCWGSRMGKTYFEVRDKETKIVLVSQDKKAPFLRAYDNFINKTFLEK